MIDIVEACELHSTAQIRAALEEGLNPGTPIRGRTAVQWLLEMYTRSDHFPECLRLLLDGGGVLDDPAIAPVLLDDEAAIRAAVHADPALLTRPVTLVSAFTPLIGATPLHVAAEYGNLRAARVLVELGADVNARAAVDAAGMNGHTPIFHTVNSSHNRSAPIMRLLIEAGARTDVLVPGITWGKGFEWETTLFDVTPVSYAQFGLLPQVHRRERDVYDNIRLLLTAAGRSVPPLDNVPNQYLRPRTA